ncbi:MAG TPA: helix-turn-helix transcriptional regulator [Phycisphaerae bacterium]|nr:helix-turn-helix transcriptional regulator [Phycisphaerae bacterium]
MKKARNKRNDSVNVEEGSGNVFADIGVKNPEEALIKARLAMVISDLIRKMNMSQADVADKLGLDQPKISMLLRGRLKDFSVERLFRIVNALEQDIRIVISPHKRGATERVRVEVAA